MLTPLSAPSHEAIHGLHQRPFGAQCFALRYLDGPPGDASVVLLQAREGPLEGKPLGAVHAKKQHARVKNISFRLETGFFSSSIRIAAGEAVLHR